MKQSEAIRIHNEAVELAQKATAKYLEEHGDNYPCGFAGVKIKPATQSFARQLKKSRDCGSKSVEWWIRYLES